MTKAAGGQTKTSLVTVGDAQTASESLKLLERCRKGSLLLVLWWLYDA